MRIEEEEDQKKHITISPGEYYASVEDVIISTLLGSCVAACLYDPVRQIMGMNHFLLSNPRYARRMPFAATEAGRYGIHAMELLINAMFKLGARRENIYAKAFGGASLLQLRTADNFSCVGEVNVRFIREFLENEKIPLVSEDLGGESGRVVHFCSGSFSVYVRKIRKDVNPELASKERKFWSRSIESQKQKVEPDLWI